MVSIRRLLRPITTDRRVLGVTAGLVGWSASGAVVPANFVAETSVPIVYAYLLVLSTFVQTLPGTYAFWAGFALFCFGISACLVGAYDAVRNRRALADHSEPEPAIRD